MLQILPQIKATTPKVLFQKVKSGVFPPLNLELIEDENQKALLSLARRYRETRSLKGKIALLLKEREMLYEELEHPELTLSRNYKSLKPFIKEGSIYGPLLEEVLNVLNISALCRIEDCLLHPFEGIINKKEYIRIAPKKILEILKSICAKPTINKENKDSIKSDIRLICDYITDKLNLPKELIKEFNVLSETTKRGDNTKFNKLIRSIDKSRKNTKIAKKITLLLEDSTTDEPTKQLAILAAGKFKSQRNYELIINKLFDKRETSLITRQNAIQSLSLYTRKHPRQVKDTLKHIYKTDETFAPLAKILLDKIEGRYYKLKDREFIYNPQLLSKKEEIKKQMSKLLELDTELNGQEINALDAEILPFICVAKPGQKIHITEDTFTKFDSESIAQREFENSYPNMGYYFDSMYGLATSNKIITHKQDIKIKTYNTISHELGHLLMTIINKTENKRLNKLFQDALKHDNFISEYSKTDVSEYFAEGCEAYASIYKPHESLLKGKTNTRYTLMEKDPKLFKFIEDILAKYNTTTKN